MRGSFGLVLYGWRVALGSEKPGQKPSGSTGMPGSGRAGLRGLAECVTCKPGDAAVPGTGHGGSIHIYVMESAGWCAARPRCGRNGCLGRTPGSVTYCIHSDLREVTSPLQTRFFNWSYRHHCSSCEGPKMTTGVKFSARGATSNCQC